MTRARPATTQTHHQMVTPYWLWIDGSSTVFARSDRVRARTGGSQTENSTPAKNPARGWSARAIQVYQPPADGNTFASCPVLPSPPATAPRPSLSLMSGGPVPGGLDVCGCLLAGYRPEVGERHPDLRRLAPVDGEHRAGDVGGVVGGEEGCRRGEFLRL